MFSLDMLTQNKNRSHEPDVRFQAAEDRENLFHAIKKLKPDYRKVIIYRFVDELSHTETARIMGINENHVRVLQHRALRQLRNILSYPTFQ